MLDLNLAPEDLGTLGERVATFTEGGFLSLDSFLFFRWLSNAWNVRADWLSGWGSHSKWGIQGLTGLKSRYATTRLLEYYWAISFQPCIKTDANMKKRCLAGLITLKSPGSIPGFATKQSKPESTTPP